MSVLSLERTAVTRLRRILPGNDPHQPDPAVRLPLRAELFLIAHDDDSGRLHLDQNSLCLGLAGAVLLELWLEGRIQIGWRYVVRGAVWELEPGRISVLDSTPVGDPILDNALAAIWRTGGALYVPKFIKQFATSGLYERVRADMIATGLLHRVFRRRWLRRRETHVPVDAAHSVRARTRLRNLATRRRHGADPGQPDHQVFALAGIVTALGLTRHLYPSEMTPTRLHQKLMDILGQRRSPTIRDIVNAINPAAKRSTPPTIT